jgi:hypothetical protein
MSKPICQASHTGQTEPIEALAAIPLAKGVVPSNEASQCEGCGGERMLDGRCMSCQVPPIRQKQYVKLP